MIAFAVQAGRAEDRRAFSSVCRKGLGRIMRRGDRLLLTRHPSSIHAAYNRAIRWAREFALADPKGFEALVLVHADAAICWPWFRESVGYLRFSQSIGGVCGPVSVPRSIAWWEYPPFRGGVVQDNGGTFHTFATGESFEGEEPGTLGAVDGVCIVLSPWAVRTLRFDEETYGDSWHGYDCDISLACREAGGRVYHLPMLVYHATKGGIRDPREWERSDAAFRRKWFEGGAKVPPRSLVVRSPLEGNQVVHSGCVAYDPGEQPITGCVFSGGLGLCCPRCGRRVFDSLGAPLGRGI